MRVRDKRCSWWHVSGKVTERSVPDLAKRNDSVSVWEGLQHGRSQLQLLRFKWGPTPSDFFLSYSADIYETCFMCYLCGLIVSIIHRLTSDPVDRQREGDVDLKLPGEISQSVFKFTKHLCHGLSPWIAVGILLKGNLQGAPRCSCFLGSVDDLQSPGAPIFHTVHWSA